MKNCSILVLLLWAGVVCAQSTLQTVDTPLAKQQIYCSYGLPLLLSGDDFSIPYINTTPIPDYEPLESNEREDYSSFGSFQAGYQYLLGKRFSLGLELQYHQLTKSLLASGVPKYSFEYQVLQPMLRFDLRHISRPNFQLYSGGAIGLVFSKKQFRSYDDSGQLLTETTDSWAFNKYGIPLRITVLGARFGRKTAFFTEVGFGLNSLVRMGVMRRF